MIKISIKVWFFLAVLLAVPIACGMFGGAEPESPPQVENPTETSSTRPAEPEQTEAQPTHTPSEPQVNDTGIPFDTEFPLPQDVQNFTLVPQYEGGINFQTGMRLDDVIAFYREAFALQGLTERTILTVIDESAFSMVFDGAPNGKAVVIQGVALTPDQTNVNIRYEDI